jgi:hypothetical protein
MLLQDKKALLVDFRFGPYVSPVIAIGVVVECEARGMVTVVGTSDGPIAWPVGERDGERQLVVFKSLARALRQEAPAAVAAAWGVDIVTVYRWRTACNQPRRRKKQTVASPPIAWTREDDDIIAHVSLAEAARITGRTLTAVRKRRRALGLPDGRMAVQRASKREGALVEQVTAVGRNLRLGISQLTTTLAELRQTFDRNRSTALFWRSQANRQPSDTLTGCGKSALVASENGANENASSYSAKMTHCVATGDFSPAAS